MNTLDSYTKLATLTRKHAAAVSFYILVGLTILSLAIRSDGTHILITLLTMTLMALVFVRSKFKVSYKLMLRVVFVAAPFIGFHYQLLNFPMYRAEGFTINDFARHPLVAIHPDADSLSVFYTHLRDKTLVLPAETDMDWLHPVWANGAHVRKQAGLLKIRNERYDPNLRPDEVQALLQREFAYHRTDTPEGSWEYLFIISPDDFTTYWLTVDNNVFYFVPENHLPPRLVRE